MLVDRIGVLSSLSVNRSQIRVLLADVHSFGMKVQLNRRHFAPSCMLNESIVAGLRVASRSRHGISFLPSRSNLKSCRHSCFQSSCLHSECSVTRIVHAFCAVGFTKNVFHVKRNKRF
ncbi:hypothetical protein CEXT_444831 [Caerostris extrusa]|uniref:Uncharacterized protein n=1 Tax=Caerostris extrusa TaxID=172846 RepID=A0AAV4N112_CAEEX|nr:hypothetical protein CEXT_444831 [Caerostris extrusa]